MGGQSTSRVAVENDVLDFTGYCAIVPSLKAPGFITAVTGNGMFRHESFVDVSSCTGLLINANANDTYTGWVRPSVRASAPLSVCSAVRASVRASTHAAAAASRTRGPAPPSQSMPLQYNSGSIRVLRAPPLLWSGAAAAADLSLGSRPARTV